MAKKAYVNNYFPHDSNARNSDKLIRLRMKHKAAGYGLYFMILERLRDEEDYMSVRDYDMIAFDLREDVEFVKSVIEDFGLFSFTEDGRFFYSESFMRRMEAKDEVFNKRSEAGKRGAERRWSSNDAIAMPTENDSNDIAMLQQSNTNAIAMPTENDSKKSKAKQRKESKDYSSSCAREGEGESHSTAIEVSKEEEKDFFEIFFFRNFLDPWKQTERFIAHNSARGWKGDRGAVFDTPEKRLSLARLWEQKDAPPGEKRFPDWFVNLWKQAYALASDEDSDIGNGLVAAEMLDRRVRAETGTGNVRKITCGPNFARWYQAHAEQIAPIFRGVKMYTWS